MRFPSRGTHPVGYWDWASGSSAIASGTNLSRVPFGVLGADADADAEADAAGGAAAAGADGGAATAGAAADAGAAEAAGDPGTGAVVGVDVGTAADASAAAI